jgi:hypothetical protein
MHPMKIRIEIPSIPLKEQTPTVKLLLGTIEQQQMAINQTHIKKAQCPGRRG